ncbi:MAG: vWA domain-containing protein [Thermomicrobium sp.]|nr:VWA domain-containing protein [Thermomicrobium sp.]MDW8007603.1 vWA domain-containing protein [Thermomicrobium sp.]
MAYDAEISRQNPTAILFLIDQSGSMGSICPDGLTPAQVLADAVNRLLSEAVLKCTKEEGVRDYFHIGVITYNGSDATDALAFVPGELVLKPVSAIANHPLRIEERVRRTLDGAGGVIERRVKFPIWITPVASGGTPMCAAFRLAYQTLGLWVLDHPTSFPPTVINVTDGEPTDGDPRELAQMLQNLATDDGNVLLYNLHIRCADEEGGVLLPASEQELPAHQTAHLLFAMSSVLPPFALEAAQAEFPERNIQPGARAYGYRVPLVEAIKFLNVGTRPFSLGR